MSAADFTTTLNVTGTKEECLKIMKVLCCCSKDMEERHREKRDCWYLSETFDSPEIEVENRWKSGKMNLVISGPYGAFGLLEDSVNLFEMIADAAPTCSFKGSISGWDAGGDQSLKAELKDGLLYFKSRKITYDPKTKTYSRFSTAPKSDSVVVTTILTDKNGCRHELALSSAIIEDPINFNCYPEDFLSDNSVENVFNILLSTIDGDDKEDPKEDIKAFKTELESKLKDVGLSKLELAKVHDHKEPLFFGWLRANVCYPEMKKLAKKVCTCAEKNKQKNIDAFEQYLKGFEPDFPWCEYTGWPVFCQYHYIESEDDLVLNPNLKLSPKLDWRCVATSVEDFAQYICSRKNPKEYAVERVIVDFETGTTEQTAVYMPGGPTPLEPSEKPTPEVIAPKKPITEDSAGTSTAPTTGESCVGMTFVITGKVNTFKNRDAFKAYVEAQGGKVSGSVSKNTTYLVNNDTASTSSKNQKAKEHGVPIISEDEFIEKYGRP